MSEAECQSTAPRPARGRYQFRLRTLLVLTAVVALTLPLFLPIMTPSPLLNWPGSGLPGSGTLEDPVGKLLASVVPRVMLRAHGGSSGADATSWRGRWHYDRFAIIQCAHAATDQIMRDLQTALRQHIQNAGAQIGVEREDVRESRLTAFRFAYTYGSHRGAFKVSLQLGTPHGNAAPSKGLPLNEVRWKIEELAGTAKTE